MGFTPGKAVLFTSTAQARQMARAFVKTSRPLATVLADVPQVTAPLKAALIAARQLRGQLTCVAYVPQNPTTAAVEQQLQQFRAELEELGVDVVVALDAPQIRPELQLPVSAQLYVCAVLQPESLFLSEADPRLCVRTQQALAEYGFGTRVHLVPVVRFANGVPVGVEQSEENIALSAALSAGAFVAEKGADAVLATAEATARQACPDAVFELVGADLGDAPEFGDAWLLGYRNDTLIDAMPVAVGMGVKPQTQA